MQTTWRPAASARSCSPTARAVCPPMPASTSSKTSVAGPGRGGDAHQREHHARELAARRRLAQRARRHAGVGGDQELDLVGAGRAGRLARRQADGEAGALHRELGEALADRVRQPRARGRPRVVQRRRVLGEHAARRLQRAARPPRAPPRRPRARRAAARTPRACSSTAAIVPPCLRLRRSNWARRSSTSSRRPGAASIALAVAAQLRGQVVGLERERLRAVGEGVERRHRRRAWPRARRPPRRARAASEPRRRRPRRRRRRAPRARPRPRRAGPRGGAAARARRSARPPRPRSDRRARSPRAPTPAGRARGRARRRGPAAPRAPPPPRAPRRRRPRTSARRAACSGPQKPSRMSSWAEASVSLRCSCWP